MAPGALLFACRTLCSEEVGQEVSAYGCVYAGDYFAAVVQAFIVTYMVEGVYGAGFGVRRAVHYCIESRKHNRPGAHAARFERYRQRAPAQPPIANNISRRSNRQHLSVRRRIGVDYSPVIRRGDNLTIAIGDNRTDRHIALILGEKRLFDRSLHQPGVLKFTFASFRHAGDYTNPNTAPPAAYEFYLERADIRHRDSEAQRTATTKCFL